MKTPKKTVQDMNGIHHCIQNVRAMVVSVSIMVIVMMASRCDAEVFTSSEKIMELATRERALLDALQIHINAEYDNLKALSGFLSERSKAVRVTSDRQHEVTAEHPNGAYHLIKLYTRDWQNVAVANPVFNKNIAHLKQNLPTNDDFQGACTALVRLQRVYKLHVQDMYEGNYAGHYGPPLHPEDTFEVGRQAFMDGFLNESVQWLELAVDKLREEDERLGSSLYHRARRGQAYGLLGRAYYFMNNTERAREIHDIGIAVDPQAGDLLQLQKELMGALPTSEYGQVNEEWTQDLSTLCMRDKTHRVTKLRPFNVCRYKRGLYLSYDAYKEEILSTSPYVSVIYDVVMDREIETLTGFVKGTMYRGMVGIGKNATTAFIRTSDLSWVYDEDMVLAKRLSDRIKVVTGLEVDQQMPDGPSSSEAFQVVNYGLGGHYDVHMDTFDKPPEDVLLNRSGERIATFLIYLSDVEKGGNTVFVKSKISVAPRKGMALFWYNVNPAMKVDTMTSHAGCPVMVGHKWIANKWIWTYGNTFRRRCGLNPDAAQLDIEHMMYPSRP